MRDEKKVVQFRHFGLHNEVEKVKTDSARFAEKMESTTFEQMRDILPNGENKMNVPLLTNDDWKGFYSCVNFFMRYYESCVLTIRVDEGNIYVKPVEAPKTIQGELVIDENKKH